MDDVTLAEDTSEGTRWTANETSNGVMIWHEKRFADEPDEEVEDEDAAWDGIHSLEIPTEAWQNLVEMFALRHPEKFARIVQRVDRLVALREARRLTMTQKRTAQS